MTIPKDSVTGQRGYSLKRRKNRPIFLAFLFALVDLIGIAGQGLAQSVIMDKHGTRLQVTERNRRGPKPKLVLYTTMATWCIACKTELPQFRHLRSVFKPEELGMFGLPYDYKEGPERLRGWVEANGPPYELLTDLTKDNVASVKVMVIKALRFDGVPATIVTDAHGRILRMRWGPPSVSELRELLWLQKDRMQK